MVIPNRKARRVVVNDGKVRQITMDYRAENATDVQLFVSYKTDVDGVPLYPDRRLTLGTEFSVEGVGGPGIAAVITNPELWVDVERFAMIVQYPVNQPTDMDLGGPFGKRYEDALDRMGYGLQTVDEKASRAIKLAPTEHVDSDIILQRPRGGMYLRFSDDGRTIVSDEGPAGGGGPSGIAEAPADGAFYSRRNYTWEPTPAPLLRPSEFMDPDALRPLTVNGVPASGGGFPTTAQQEIVYAFAGGSINGDLPNLAGTDLATCHMGPPTEDSTNWVFATTPWREYGGEFRRIMPLDIRTSFVNSPVSIPLFKPIMTNGFGFLVWEYIGEEPIHTILTGTINVLIRQGGEVEDAHVRHVMRLSGFDLPQLELGQNNGKRHLATAAAGFNVPQQIRHYLEYNDINLPVTTALINSVSAGANLFVGYDVGSIASGSNADALVPGAADVRTTKWMDVAAFDKLLTSFVFYDVGVSSISYIQYRLADGVTRYYPAHSLVDSSQRVFRLPVGTTQVRIHYSRTGDAPGASPKFKALSTANSAAYDTLKGYWTLNTFSVNRDVTFWPGSKYCIDFLSQVFSDQGNAREWGFRYQSGGLQFHFDAGRVRKKIAKTFYDSEAI